MDRFRICPRCDKEYWMPRLVCKYCKFVAFRQHPARYIAPGKYYEFQTEKYIVLVHRRYPNISFYTDIYNKRDTKEGLLFYNNRYTIPKAISPKATDSDIDKLLILT